MSRKELQGLSFLTALIVFLWFLPNLYRLFFPPQKSSVLELRELEIRNFLSKNSQKNEDRPFPLKEIGNEDGYKSSTLQNRTPEYFPFNPNALKFEEGQRLGLSDYQIKMIQNYVSKGGQFYRKEDLAKIYSITEDDFKRLSPYINIPERKSNQRAFSERVSDPTKFISHQEKPLSIELNQTDSIELQLLPGIGPVFASRIIRFRDLLGGFHSKDQLLQVYGMDDERYRPIQEQVYVDTSHIKKISINSVDYQSLNKHPQITSKEANVIIQYRNQHGSFTRPEDLLKIAIINEEFLRKIAPYLTFGDD